MAGIYDEARRQLSICNACRYCEGYCAVWDEIENMNVFTNSNVQHLSNLCHDCRECFTVCPYTDPHEFSLNIPKLFSIVRYDSYNDHIKPSFMKKAFRNQSPLWISVIGVTLLLSFILEFINTSGNLFAPISISNMGAIIPDIEFKFFSFVLYAYLLIMWSYEGYFYYRSISPEKTRKQKRGLAIAIYDALSHKFFKGGGAGCNYPEEKNRSYRLIFHPMIFFGFIIDLIAILFYSNFNVIITIIYTLGSLLMVIGSGGLLVGNFISKKKAPSLNSGEFGNQFIIALLITGVTGFMLPVVSRTILFIVIFGIHIAFIASILILAPYSKFLHPVFRFISLLKYENKNI